MVADEVLFEFIHSEFVNYTCKSSENTKVK